MGELLLRIYWTNCEVTTRSMSCLAGTNCNQPIAETW